MTRIRVLFVLYAPSGGGAERVTINLLRRIDRVAFEPALLLFNRQGEYAAMLPNDIPVHSLDVPRPFMMLSPGLLIRVVSFLWRSSPDVIFSNIGWVNIVVLCAACLSRTRAPVVVREATTMSRYYVTDPMGAFKRLIYGWLYPQAAAVVVPSPEVISDMRAFLGRCLPAGQVIMNGVDGELVDTLTQAPAALPVFLTQKTAPVLILVGRLDKGKAVDVAIRAFARIHQRHCCRLIILGQGPEETALKMLAAELKVAEAVHFAGFQSNPFAYMKAADIFLMTSRFEGFSNALLEAMHCGLPSVVCRYSIHIGDFLEEAGCGVLAHPDDPDDIADKVLALLQDPSRMRSLSVAARHKASLFTLSRMTLSYETLFAAVFSRGKAGL